MKRLVTFCLAATLALVGCSGTKPGDVYRNAPNPSDSVPPANPVTLKIGHLPAVEALPLWIAEQWEYYGEEGVQVELVAFSSAAERDAALTDGSLDGVLTDMISAIALYGKGNPVQIVSLTVGATPEGGPTGILVPPDSPITKVEELKGVEIAISTNSVIHYAAEKLLEENGFIADDIALVAIADPDERLEGLFNGEVHAAVLTEPQLTRAMAYGAQLITTDVWAKNNYSQWVFLFHKDSIEEKGDGIKRFHRAYVRGAAMTQVTPSGHNDLLVERANLPEDIAEFFGYAPFPLPQAPRQGDVERAVDWLFGKQLIKSKPTYEQLVNKSVLP